MSFHAPIGTDLKKSSAWTGITASIILFIMVLYKMGVQKFLPSNQTVTFVFAQVMGEDSRYHTLLYIILFILVLYSSIVGFYYDEY